MENVYRLENKENSGRNTRDWQLVMMLQEIVFTEYFRVYCLAVKVRIMQYEPRNAPHLR
jgi:hypothetical protein